MKKHYLILSTALAALIILCLFLGFSGPDSNWVIAKYGDIKILYKDVEPPAEYIQQLKDSGQTNELIDSVYISTRNNFLSNQLRDEFVKVKTEELNITATDDELKIFCEKLYKDYEMPEADLERAISFYTSFNNALEASLKEPEKAEYFFEEQNPEHSFGETHWKPVLRMHQEDESLKLPHYPDTEEEIKDGRLDSYRNSLLEEKILIELGVFNPENIEIKVEREYESQDKIKNRDDFRKDRYYSIYRMHLRTDWHRLLNKLIEDGVIEIYDVKFKTE